MCKVKLSTSCLADTKLKPGTKLKLPTEIDQTTPKVCVFLVSDTRKGAETPQASMILL